MKVNEYLVRISASKAPFTNELNMGQEVIFGGKGTVTKIEDTDNFDSTIDRIYTIKIEFVEDMTYKIKT